MSLTCPFGHLGEKPTGVAPPCPAASRSRYRDRMLISPGLDATAAWQAAALAAQLGGSQANISAHLIGLKQSGLITSRAHGPSSAPCYRPPGSGPPKKMTQR